MAKKHDTDVRVRMYRQGLGDCFLLTFPRKTKPFHLLIDCGALASDDALMRKVVADIKNTTGGRLDVIAATHEHWDHISGFAQAKEIFDEIDVDKVWVAWTEEPGNDAAKTLRERFKKQKKAVEMALSRIPDDARNAQLRLYKDAITHLFDFAGGLGAAGGKAGTAEAWKYILGKAQKVYCDPKKKRPLELDGVDGVRVYVLGPPDDPEYVKRLLSKQETYDTGLQPISMAESFLAAVASDDVDPESKRRAMPFDVDHRILEPIARTDPFFRTRYGFDAQGGPDWRRIDTDWLTTAGELALHLDSYTNNTCLALAIELVDSGRVLLFPGDAQVGNWLSWGDRAWSVDGANGEKQKVTVDDLLERTVLYKVGHHGSHNATMRGKGLEMMTSSELVAMIPVNRKTAKAKKWKFPYQPLWNRLKEKTGGRVVLADELVTDDLEAEIKQRLSAAAWKRFQKSLTMHDLYVEYRVEM